MADTMTSAAAPAPAIPNSTLTNRRAARPSARSAPTMRTRHGGHEDHRRCATGKAAVEHEFNARYAALAQLVPDNAALQAAEIMNLQAAVNDDDLRMSDAALAGVIAAEAALMGALIVSAARDVSEVAAKLDVLCSLLERDLTRRGRRRCSRARRSPT
jgi:hypothetical protein